MKFNVLKSKKNIVKIVVVLLVVLMVAAIAHNVIKNKKVESQNKIQNVNVAEAKLDSLTTTVDYSGKLNSDKDVSISPKTPGKVQALNVKVGSTVKAGDILFTLDSTSLQAQLQQQQASIQSAAANLDKTKSSGVEQQIVQQQQALNTAQINYNDAENNYNREQSLYSAGAAPKQDLDNATTKLENAEASLSAAQQNLDLTRQKVGPESVEVAQAQVNQAQAGLKSIQSQIDDNVIKSPISGVVSAVNIHQGEITSGSQASVTIVDSSSIMAEVNVPDTMLSKIKVGQSIPVTIPSLSDKKLTGTVDTITPNADSKTQQYLIKVRIPNSDASLTSGMYSKVSFPDQVKNNVMTVPNETIKVENGVSYLFVVRSNKVKKVAVTTGLSNDKVTEITSSNIESGDRIITSGQTFLNDGDKVKVLN
ncbi:MULTISPECIES: efflux RND transporter periplasmic adaptor subunit [Clostridium]|uniref:Macrolide export protein MacA n=3 Tax=Clostridium TaxID=1485 RepID=D8GL26_CLOLD|nr:MULTISPECIES: efflux RND transporter periplasmic adaptor subunit [Clostridium]ADK15385.1 putative secretion protein [Clostridium ljungdahlii DSM 13528]AGY74619.1 efflux RND transporter periplasmic adaptor subunit [Clostridium autoethanogenum DSM 10061]ALU34804.1 RND-type efflux system membrane fusion protein [Clostridium autoethanogenum DSM 10061]OAA88485.1 Macrolide export protein MacA [Clostridium ljungdahlii DSM 13528]OVY51523.1 Macrolide export protein MacA [Clostridium autoethanogenum]